MDFCVSIATQLILDQVKNGSSENILTSPMSINMMLNMVASGSGGKTLEQFKEFLGSEGINDFNDKSSIMMSLLASETAAASSSDETETTKPMPKAMFDGAPQNPMPWESPYSSLRELPRKKRQRRPPLFSLAKALWVDNGFPLIPSFKEITESIYKAQVKNVDFRTQAEQVKKDVNSWVENETKGLIQGLLSPDVELEPPLCLANALYFKGAWEHTFDISMNLDKKFYLLNGETIEVSFMTFAYECRSYASFDDYKVLKLPYQSGPQCTNKQFSMYFFLPHRRFGLQDMMEKFNSDRTILEPKHLHLDEVRLSKVWIPKLKFSYSVDAIQLIEDKGLTRPFDPMEADFTNMSNGSNVFISRILHKSHIEVNAEGTEAAAVTFVEESDLFGSALDWSPPPPLPSFVADHPFMFMVVEEFSKLVVFSGAVLNPNE
ncbi:Serpin family [Trema orientale]|uniref:Serpin family n=1 Tax=Trema orientale TaxID=63057 RepID=A0A2P5FUM8_TREOI|nr:Serpin family [Trema orientale]